jgi:hypothetical protein
MAYEPNQPWDKNFSYSYGQTCTYNGYNYTFIRLDEKSSVGVEPNKEEAMFTAIKPESGESDQRLERCWLVYDYRFFLSENTIRAMQPFIRGTPPVSSFAFYRDAEYTGNQYNGYWSPNNQNSEQSWIFYGQPRGISSEIGLATEENPIYNGNGNIVIKNWLFGDSQIDTITESGTIPILVQTAPEPPVPDEPRTFRFDILFLIPVFNNEARLSNYNCFNRNGVYEIKYTITDFRVSPPIARVYKINDSVSTGDVRDNWGDPSSYPRKKYVITWDLGESMTIDYVKLTDITPRFDE